MIPTKLTLGKKIDKNMLEKAGFIVGTYASQILEKVTFGKKCEVELKVMSVSELGFKDWTKYSDICTKIKELGYELCPAEVGLALRLAYEDQPLGEWLHIAMEPLPDSDDDLGVFGLGRGARGLYLSSDYGSPGALYGPDYRFVCLVPRKFGSLVPLESRDLDFRTFEQEFHDVYYGPDHQGFSKLCKWVYDKINE